MSRRVLPLIMGLAVYWAGASGSRGAEGGLAPVSARFADATTDEVPDFQRHVAPLLGRLGCNGRACHGSFQGQGGFRLSLFGYDFQADYRALVRESDQRVRVDDPEASLILEKPTMLQPHKGGKRMEVDGWEYNLLLRWIEAGAPGPKQPPHQLVRLAVEPSEIVFGRVNERVQLRVLAHWADGTVEDVTPLCRYEVKDDAVAQVNQDGIVVATGGGDTHVVVYYDNGVAPVPVLLPVTDLTGDRYPDVPTPTEIDRLVVAKLRKLGIVPSKLCSDAEFLRRVRLDLTGTLPSEAEVLEFLSDTRPDKRARKIDELLDSDEYAAWWATKLCDITGNNAAVMGEPAIRRQQAEMWWYWMYHRVRTNMPYDKIVEGIVLATGKQPGQSYREYCAEMTGYLRPEKLPEFGRRPTLPHFWARTNMRQPADRAIWVAYAFLGMRIECAQCHKHPFDRWSKRDFEQFAALFAPISYNYAPESRPELRALLRELGLEGQRGGQLRRRVLQLARQGKTVPWREVFVNRSLLRRGRGRGRQRAVQPKLLGGDVVDVTRYSDPREAFMEWLRQEDNPYFAAAFVNRVWAHYFGVGIVNPPDELSAGNPPSNKPLLDYLVRGFIRSGYDMKWLHRTILNSRTYQLSAEPNETNVHDQRNFSRYLIRRLPAEVLYDALQLATAGPELEQRLRNDPIDRAIGLAGGQGVDFRRSRGTQYLLAAFGKPARSTNCDCERSNEPNLLQTLLLQNDSEVLGMISRSDGWAAAVARAEQPAPAANQDRLRPPSERERQRLERAVRLLEKRVRQLQRQRRSRQARLLRLRIAQIRQKLQVLSDRGSANSGREQQRRAAKKPPTGQLRKLVRSAFLRTLSREPDQQEMTRSIAYLREADSLRRGLEDLLWALVNTKEFGTNH